MRFTASLAKCLLLNILYPLSADSFRSEMFFWLVFSEISSGAQVFFWQQFECLMKIHPVRFSPNHPGSPDLDIVSCPQLDIIGGMNAGFNVGVVRLLRLAKIARALSLILSWWSESSPPPWRSGWDLTQHLKIHNRECGIGSFFVGLYKIRQTYVHSSQQWLPRSWK